MQLAWHILLTELFLGGGGHLVELWGLSIRLLLTAGFLALFFARRSTWRFIASLWQREKNICLLLASFGFFLVFSFCIGFWSGHPLKLMIQDLIPFGFFLLFIPFSLFLKEEKTRKWIASLSIVSIFGTAGLLLSTFFLFSSGIAKLQDPFYKWFRDVNMGKITDMGAGFFRVVDPTHLLLVPATLIVLSLLIKKQIEKKLGYALLFALSLSLVIDLSRIYALALFAGLLSLLVLLFKEWKRWTMVTALLGLFLFSSFASLSYLGSGGKSFGLELLGLRTGSIARPKTEVSAATRMALLPAIFEMIQQNPVLGAGPGASVTFYNTQTNRFETTSQFDWGYFEFIAEFGILGTTLFLLGILMIGYRLWKKALETTIDIKKINSKLGQGGWTLPDELDGITILFILPYFLYFVFQFLKNISGEALASGLLAGLLSLFVIMLTAPAFFHLYGMVFLAFVTAFMLQKETNAPSLS